VKSSTREHQLPPDLIRGEQNSTALISRRHLNSTESNQGGTRNLPNPRRARREAWSLPTRNSETLS